MQHFFQSKLLCISTCNVLIAAQISGINPSFAAQATTCQKNQLEPLAEPNMWWKNLLGAKNWEHTIPSLRTMQTRNYVTNKYASRLNFSNNRKTRIATNFLVLGGGGAPDYNEIALEKNVLYFQRTLHELRYNPVDASIFFANGNDGKATVRYLDQLGREQFKVPKIPNLKGASTLVNLQNWMKQTARKNPEKPIFFYFTGHGAVNTKNRNNNSLALWNEELLSVRQFSQMLDELPRQTSVTVVMTQCYSGSFANFIYQGGDPKRPIALQTRCGFFATIKSLPSVGCTPSVNEADYRDYSSSFFAGLSGRNRIGQRVASADYNQDGRISYAEAHAFAKVDERTMDLPISTSEAWLQDQAFSKDVKAIYQQPIAKILKTARTEQQYVVKSIVQMQGWNLNKSFVSNLDPYRKSSEEQKAYVSRLGRELVNISMENQIRNSKNQQAITVLNRLVKCESGYPQ